MRSPGLLCGGLGVFDLNPCFDGQPFGVVPQTAVFAGKVQAWTNLDIPRTSARSPVDGVDHADAHR